MPSLKSQNIIFSTDGILGFRESIESALTKSFNNVYYIDHDIPEKKDRSIYFKVLRELKRKTKNKLISELLDNKQRVYQDSLLANINENIDYFFVVAGREFTESFIKKIKEKNPKIICILFLWDKFDETSLRLNAHLFDLVFTFDKNDAEYHNFIFRPSFFINECLENPVEWPLKKHSILYVGAMRDRARYDLIEKIYNYNLSEKDKKTSFLKLYVNPKNKNKLSREHDKKLIVFEKIPYIRLIEKIKESKVVLDIPYGDQKGLTLRAIESIATNTKIITTNEDIINYDFFNKKNILVINKKNIDIPTDFFTSPIEPAPDAIKFKYSALGFIEDIFNHVKTENS